ncbi:hypothetical protein N7466_003871 [Penicillium verhagenii]|uniref:uncharacterized protein n=1 Tax=Penicillium verhagenii TaxID=1562060 RepID=UPI0025455E2C|nr:uncharacterized protein N7466_003871 [Penicillium verhagenii]KAJ5934324.1 hypothetical protein N7466_003871 [Penicillium verhagenii]
MSNIDWVQLAQYPFFDNRKSPSATQCDDIAESITGATKIVPVDSLSKMSYSVICNNCSSLPLTRIVVFREENSRATPLDNIVDLAEKTFGPLAPKPTYYKNLDGADPPLSIFTMPCQPGISLLSTLRCQSELSRQQRTKQACFIRDLARYFALAWSNKQPMNPPELLYIRQAGIRHQLRQFKQQAPSILPAHKIDELIQILPTLFSTDYPSVLTNGNLSLTNIRVDEATYGITNIVDWSLAKVLPFGMDLDILFLVTGYMGLRRWRDYKCKQFMLDCFWDEFWASVDPRGDRESGRVLAEKAARVGALLRYGFTRREDGASDSVVSVSERDVGMLRAWFGVVA